MTSFIIKEHEVRTESEWSTAPHCTFCCILRGESPAHKVYEDDMVFAILDIYPLRRGHTLVIPKPHVSRVSELPDEFAARLGIAVSRIARAITEAFDNTGLNVVCNQEYAQAVPHVHYHIIPAPLHGPRPMDPTGDDMPLPTTVVKPESGASGVLPATETEMHIQEIEARSKLEDIDATGIVESIKARL